ncbi:MAG: hypothetical protein KC589_09385, partial [Nanoarchaeota archaeon]|nr:hypothetical protein [Nanoarchaeota archaeon]
DPSKIDYDGFVLLACEEINGDLFISNKVGVLSGLNYPNTPLSWANLHDKYFDYNRFLISGNINNIYREFKSNKRFKKQEKFKIPLCCANDFDPDKYMTTFLGEGEVSTSTMSFKDKTLEIELKYK